MRRKAVIVVAALATGRSSPSAAERSRRGVARSKLVTKNFRFKAADHPPRPRSQNTPAFAGDTFVISALVTDRAGARRGRVDAACTVTRGGQRGGGVCEGIYALARGEIHLLARLTFAEEGDAAGSIVGGTRANAGARGTFTSRDRPGERGGDPSDDTLTLLP